MPQSVWAYQFLPYAGVDNTLHLNYDRNQVLKLALRLCIRTLRIKAVHKDFALFFNDHEHLVVH